MADNLADLIPGPECCTEDAQAFSERMTAGGPGGGVPEALEFARRGHYGMALYAAYQAAQRAGNQAAPGVLTDAAQLVACLDAAAGALAAVRAALAYGPPPP